MNHKIAERPNASASPIGPRMHQNRMDRGGNRKSAAKSAKGALARGAVAPAPTLGG
jgi:hypothetical protein